MAFENPNRWTGRLYRSSGLLFDQTNYRYQSGNNRSKTGSSRI